MRKTMAIMLAIGLFSAMPALAEHKKDVNTAGQETATTHTHQDAGLCQGMRPAA